MSTSFQRYINILGPVVTCALIVAVSWMLDFQNVVQITDPDAFYHYKMAHEYCVHGILYSQFPWLTASMVGKLHGDLWYGFHLMLMPLAGLPDSVADLKTASALVMSLAGLAVYFAFRASGIKLAPLWTMLFLLGAGGQIGRLLMIRPQALSLGLTALVFAGLMRRNRPMTFAACLLLAFVHLNMIGLPLLVMAVVMAAEWLLTRKIDWRTPALGLAGLAIGMLVRPAPFDTVHLFLIQVGQLYLVKLQGIKLDWGTELSPAKPQYVADYYGGFLALYLCATAFGVAQLVRRAQIDIRHRVYVFSAWILSAMFIAMIFVSASRCTDQWVLFAVIYIAGLYSFVIAREPESTGDHAPVAKSKKARKPAWLVPGVAVAVVAAVSYQAYLIGEGQLALGVNATRFRQPCYWLRDHAPAGSIVFNPFWAYFPEMFFWNDRCRYVGAMDPVFEYAYSRRLYYEWDSLTEPKYTAYTSTTAAGNPADLVDTYVALTRDFHASYVMTTKQMQPAFFHYLATNPNYRMVYFDSNMGIFAVRPPNIPLAPRQPKANKPAANDARPTDRSSPSHE